MAIAETQIMDGMQRAMEDNQLDAASSREVMKFAGSKYRGNAATLQAMHGNVHRLMDDLRAEFQKMIDYCNAEKSKLDEMKRNAG